MSALPARRHFFRDDDEYEVTTPSATSRPRLSAGCLESAGR
jgi:hypothetical protein